MKEKINKGIAITETILIISRKSSGLSQLNREENIFPAPVREKIKTSNINTRIKKIPLMLLFIHPEKSFFLIGNFSRVFAAITPVTVAQKDPNRDVPIIIAGSVLPAAARVEIAVTGIKVIPS